MFWTFLYCWLIQVRSRFEFRFGHSNLCAIILLVQIYFGLKIIYISRVFLLRLLWIINYDVKSSSNNLSNENINTSVSVVFKTKHELKCQNELHIFEVSFLRKHQCLYFHSWDYFRNFWPKNWLSIIVISEWNAKPEIKILNWLFRLFQWNGLGLSHCNRQ